VEERPCRALELQPRAQDSGPARSRELPRGQQSARGSAQFATPGGRTAQRDQPRSRLREPPQHLHDRSRSRPPRPAPYRAPVAVCPAPPRRAAPGAGKTASRSLLIRPHPVVNRCASLARAPPTPPIAAASTEGPCPSPGLPDACQRELQERQRPARPRGSPSAGGPPCPHRGPPRSRADSAMARRSSPSLITGTSRTRSATTRFQRRVAPRLTEEVAAQRQDPETRRDGSLAASRGWDEAGPLQLVAAERVDSSNWSTSRSKRQEDMSKRASPMRRSLRDARLPRARAPPGASPRFVTGAASAVSARARSRPRSSSGRLPGAKTATAEAPGAPARPACELGQEAPPRHRGLPEPEGPRIGSRRGPGPSWMSREASHRRSVSASRRRTGARPAPGNRTGPVRVGIQRLWQRPRAPHPAGV